MKTKIMILSVLKYTDKKTGEVKTRLGFIFDDENYNVENSSFKGYSELSCFYDCCTLILQSNDFLIISFVIVSNTESPS